VLASKEYTRGLVLAAIIGVPVSAVAYGFLWLVQWLQNSLYTTLPKDFGLSGTPAWWPMPLLVLSGLLVAAAVTYLPGTGGHEPADGLKAGGVITPEQLPGVVLAALASLGLGAVVGPEAPLIAIGSGLGALAVRAVAKGATAQATALIAAAGSFAAIASLLGSPLTAAFLLMEVTGLGAMTGVVLLPGLLAAGVGSLIFVGLNALTGVGTFSLALPHLPNPGAPTLGMFCWAVVAGPVFAALGWVVREAACRVQPLVAARRLVVSPIVGLVVGGLAAIYAEASHKPVTLLLFSGQSALPQVVSDASQLTVGALLVLAAMKACVYVPSLAAFRGGPVFPGLFIGGVVGLAAGHLPGMNMVAGLGIGLGGMSVAMLGLPLFSTVLAALLLGTSGTPVIPLVIVTVVVAHITVAHLPVHHTPDMAAAPPPPPVPQPAT